MNVRKIPNKHVSMPGIVSSEKPDSMIAVESTLESDFAELLEFDHRVKKYISQPIRISLNHSWYYPDFLVQYHDWYKQTSGKRDTYVEIKPYKKTQLPDFQLRFDEIREKVYSMDHDFEIYTENEIRSTFLNNVKRLNYVKLHSVDVILRSMILRWFDQHDSGSPREVLDEIGGGLYERSHGLFIIWNLVAHRVLSTDLLSILSLDSEVWKTDRTWEQ